MRVQVFWNRLTSRGVWGDLYLDLYAYMLDLDEVPIPNNVKRRSILSSFIPRETDIEVVVI